MKKGAFIYKTIDIVEFILALYYYPFYLFFVLYVINIGFLEKILDFMYFEEPLKNIGNSQITVITVAFICVFNIIRLILNIVKKKSDALRCVTMLVLAIWMLLPAVIIISI